MNKQKIIRKIKEIEEGCGRKISLKKYHLYCGDSGMYKLRLCSFCLKRKKILEEELNNGLKEDCMVNKIKMTKKVMIEYALNQMTGFKLGKWGADIRELVGSMGLKKKEWEHIKKDEESGHLDEDDIKTIDEYFAEQEDLE